MLSLLHRGRGRIQCLSGPFPGLRTLYLETMQSLPSVGQRQQFIQEI